MRFARARSGTRRSFARSSSTPLAASTRLTLLPVPRALLPVVSSASRGGLSGVVGDTSFNALADAEVRIVGHGEATRTDSLGGFFMPLKAGSYLVRVGRPGYDNRLVSVIIPPDSGRKITVFLPPAQPVPVREAHNLEDLEQRLAWRTQRTSRVYTRAELMEQGIEWVNDAVSMAYGSLCVQSGQSCTSDRDCMAVVNGGPATVRLGALTVDDVETIEIYYRRQPLPSAAPSRGRGGQRPPVRAQSPTVPMSNTNRADIQNGARNCLTAYVWTR